MSFTSSGRVNPNDEILAERVPIVVHAVPDNGFLQPPPLLVRMICELIGTCLFVFYGAAAAVNTSASPDEPLAGLLTVSVAHGLVTMWLVYVFGPVSGGHFNAGATVAFALDGKMKISEFFGYLFAQALGALLAGGLIYAIYGTVYGSTLGTPHLSPGVTLMHGYAIEFICTTILSFVIFFTTSYNTQKEAAFPIGLVVLSSFLIGANRDGAALNPWRWFGPAVISSTYGPEAWIYIVGPIAGFAFGYLLFRLYKLIWNGNNYQRL